MIWRQGRRAAPIPRHEIYPNSKEQTLSQPGPRVGQVFVPGRLPEHTYNPRTARALEQRVRDYLDERGTILTVAGPTKTGKSVLLKQVVENPIWLEGQGITGPDALYRRIGDGLNIYTNHTVGSEFSSETEGTAGSELSIPMFLKVDAQGSRSASRSDMSSMSVERPLSMVLGKLIEAQRTLVIDDFHFVDRGVQRQLVRALKPAVLAGVPIVLVSISHRAQDVVTAEPDMTGRVTALDVAFWSIEELIVIAEKGLAILNIVDANGIASRLAEQSYGSPHLMQQFCREVCKADNIREPLSIRRQLADPDNWAAFFRAQLDTASKDWFNRLLRGPQQKGKTSRTIWNLKDGRQFDGYGLTLAAIASTGPKLNLTKDEITTAVANQIVPPPPALHQTTRVLHESPRVCRRLRLLGRMGSCREDLGATRRSCGTVLFGWWRRFGRSMLRSGRPLSRWRRILGSVLRRPSTTG